MAYVTTTDLELAAGGAERLVQLADYSGAGSANEEVLASVIAEAEAVVNKALHFRYAVPLAEPIPQAVKSLVAREAIWLMKLARDMVSDADLTAHEERMHTLQDIGAGRLTLGVYPAPLKSTHVVDRVSGPADDAPVSRDSLKGFA